MKKLIALLCLVASCSFGQALDYLFTDGTNMVSYALSSTQEWGVVVSDLASALANGNDANGLSITNLLDPVADQDAVTKSYTDARSWLPAYACLSLAADPEHTASSAIVTDGTIDGGTVTNTRVLDNSYFVVGENSVDKWNIQFTFTNLTGNPGKIDWTGYYDGNPAHAIDLDMWNFTSSQWDTVEADAFPSDGTTPFSVSKFVPSPETNYISSGTCTVRVDHTSVGTASHEFGTDYLFLLEEQLTFPTGGVYELVSGYTECVTSANINNGSGGSVTSTVAGKFAFNINASFSGSANTIYQFTLFTNGVASDHSFYRRIGSGGDVGNAGTAGIEVLEANDSMSVKVKSNTDDAFLAFEGFHFNLQKIDN